MPRSGLRGVSRLRRLLRKLPDDIRQPVSDAIREGAELIAEEARRRVPVDTGALRNAITVVRGASRDGLSWRAGVPKPKRGKKKTHPYYARFVEFGVRPQTKGERILRVDRRRAGKGKVSRNQTQIAGRSMKRSYRTTKGQAAHPFLYPAFAAMKRLVFANIGRAVKTALARAGRNEPTPPLDAPDVGVAPNKGL